MAVLVKIRQQVGEFDVLEQRWQEYIEQFPYDAQFPEVDNRKGAVDVADVVLNERFPEEDLFKYYPYKVCYDASNDCWLVLGRMPLCDSHKGYIPCVIIDGNGSVLAVVMQ